jgi:hypothetical protein
VEKDNADIVDTRCIARTAGERSNATAFENTGCGAVNVRGAGTWAAGIGTKIVKLIADRIVTERAKTPLILMAKFLRNRVTKWPVGNFRVVDLG